MSYQDSDNVNAAPEHRTPAAAVTLPPRVYPKHGTQAQRVLNALFLLAEHGGSPTIGEIAKAASTSETGASARIRELRSKYGFDITVNNVLRDGKQRYYYSIRTPR